MQDAEDPEMGGRRGSPGEDLGDSDSVQKPEVKGRDPCVCTCVHVCMRLHMCGKAPTSQG